MVSDGLLLTIDPGCADDGIDCRLDARFACKVSEGHLTDPCVSAPY